MNDSVRSALINIIKANRIKMGRSQRRRGVKPTRWLYPRLTETRYVKMIRAWLRPMIVYVHDFLKENQEAILRGDSVEFRADAADDLLVSRMDAVPGKTFKVMINSLNGWLGQYVPDGDPSVSGSPIYLGLGNIADSVFDFNDMQFAKGAKTVLGVEFPTGEDWWPDARDTWATQNYNLIRSDMQRYIGQINDLTEKAVTSGSSVRELARQIGELDDTITKARANFIARDQIGKLNGQITQQRMEEAGLSMYIWETSGDERVRSTHAPMDYKLCRWDDSTVYSDDGGKTWKDRPSGAVDLHPGMDYQCRCTAVAYWQELVEEADEQIDLLSENQHTIPNSGTQGLNVMTPPSARTRDEMLRQQAEAREARRLQENAKKAKAEADRLFPGEKWKKVEDGIFLSPRRPTGAKSSYKTELHNAQILRRQGSTVYLVAEDSRLPGKKYDAIVNGMRMEFKNQHGASTRTLRDHFFTSRGQAPNVFINLERSPLSRREAINTLYAARNSADYAKKNKFKGGRIILKIKGQSNLIYLGVDDLKI